ncbi:MAG: glycosyltransferase family 39 protein [Methanomassiliicoccus sp.]|nr:glycosyltransferase family 39 protein [Methanomassiliicoccus sp.]
MEANAGRPEGRSQKERKPAKDGLRSRFKGSDTWLGRNWSTVLILVAVIFIALFVRSYYGYSTAVDNGFLVAGGSDSYYHQRVIGYVVDNGDHLVNDPLLNYPMGIRNMRPPLYDWSVAVTSMVMSGVSGMSINDSAGFTLLFSTPFWGALTIIPLYLITRAAFGNRAGLLASLLFALMPGHITRSVLGYADHDAMVLFFVVFALYFLLRALMSIKGTKWVPDWKDRKGIRPGIRAYLDTNRRSLIFAMLGGICVATVGMIWTGYTYLLVIVLVYFLVQVLINRFRNADSMGEFFIVGTMMLTAFAVMAPLYWQMNYWGQWFDVPFYLFLGSMVIGGIFMVTRDYPWTLVIPATVGIIAIGLVAIFFISPNIFEAIVSGQGYLVKSKLYSTIQEASAPNFSNLAMSFGPVTFWLAIIGVAWAAVKIPKNQSPHYVFIVVWMGVSMYMAASAARFMFNASPAFAMAAGWILALLIGLLKFEDLSRAFSGFRSNPWTTIKKGVKLRHVAGVLFLAVLIILPNVWVSLDAGIPSETKKDYDRQIFNALPNALHPPSYDVQNGTYWYLGAFSYSLPLPTTYYPAAWSWFSQQDADQDIADRPAYLSWWDYGFEAVQKGQHPTVADNFQNGYQFAGSFLMAENESDGVALFMVRLLEKVGVNQTTADILTAHGADASAVKDIMEHPENYVQTVKDNPEVYGNFTDDLSVTNAKYAAARVELSKAGLDNMVAMYHDLRGSTGYDIGYVAVDSRLFPFSATSSNIFYAPAKLNDRAIDPTSNSPTDYYTIKAILSDYSVVDLSEVTSSDQVLGYQIYYTDLFYKTMLYRTFMGLSPDDVGATSQGIPGISGSMTSYDAMPGYNLTHFRQVYRTAYFNPYGPADVANHSADWKAISFEEAQYLQSQIDAGLMTGTVDKTAYSLQSGVVFIQYYDGAVLRGVATSNDGSPLANIHVTVVDEMGIPHQVVETASDGSYEVLLPFGNTSVVFSVGDLKGDTLIGAELDRLVYNVSYAQSMRLEEFNEVGNAVLPTSVVSGAVFWDVNGDGRFGTGDEYISGANVTLTNNATGFSSTVESGTNGSFSIVGVAGDSNDLYATFNGHTFGQQTLKTVKYGTASRNIAIQPATVTGTLSFLTGGTADGVAVSITDGASGKVTNTTTGAGGAFTFGRLLPGNYTVSTADKNISAGSVSVSVGAGDSKAVSLSMQAATQVTGAVTLEGQAQAGVPVGFISANREMFTTTDSSGNYAITLPQDTYTVYALTSVGGTDQVAMVPLDASANTATVDLALSPGSVITGTVKDGDNPVGSARVTYTRLSDGAFLTGTANTTGAYRLVLPSGDYFVYAKGSSKAFWGNLGITGSGTQDIVLQDSVSISGKTWYDLNANGEMDTSEGVPGTVLSVMSTTNAAQTVSFLSDASGNYNLTLPKGNGYQLSASLDGYASWQKTYDPLDASVTENIEMVANDRTVTGTVTSGGTALGGVTVTFNPNGGGAQAATATTDGSGAFSVNLRPGTYTMVVDQNVTAGDDTRKYQFSGALTVEVGKNPAAQAIAVTERVKVSANVAMGSSASGSVRFIGPQNITVSASSAISEYLLPGTYTVYTDIAENGQHFADLRSETFSTGSSISISPQPAHALTGQLQFDGSDLSVPATITIGSGAATLPINANSRGAFTTYLVNGTYSVGAEYDARGTVDGNQRYISYVASQNVTMNGELTTDIALTRELNNATISGSLSGASSSVTWSFVALSDTAIDATATSDAGSYSVSLAPGTYSAYGRDGSNNVFLGVITVNANSANTANLTFETGILVSGVVRSNGAGVSGATVTFSDNAQATATTDGSGNYVIYLPSGTYNGAATWINEEVAGVNVTHSANFDLSVTSATTRDVDLVRQLNGAVEVSWDSGTIQTVNAGQTVTYTVTVNNRGNVDDTYRLSTDSKWNVTFSENDLVMPWGAGSSRTVQVTIVVPEDAKVNHSPIKITATSINRTGAVGSENLDVNVNPTYKVSVTQAPQAVDASAVTLPFVIRNEGNAQDSYNFTIANLDELAIDGWSARIAGTSADYRLVTVSAGSSQTVNVILTKANDSPDLNASVRVGVAGNNVTASSEQTIQRTSVSLPDGGLNVSGNDITNGAPQMPASSWFLVALIVLLLVVFVVLRVNKGVFGRRRKR